MPVWRADISWSWSMMPASRMIGVSRDDARGVAADFAGEFEAGHAAGVPVDEDQVGLEGAADRERFDGAGGRR